MKRATTSIRAIVRAASLVLALLVSSLVGGSIQRAAAGAEIQSTCGSCSASLPAVAIDPASYKLWPSGSRTFLNVRWGEHDADASFDVTNLGNTPLAAFVATVQVSNHNPITQTPIDQSVHSYPIPPLAPGASTTVTVPLNPTQCDIFVTVDLGNGDPTVLRTGNPAAC